MIEKLPVKPSTTLFQILDKINEIIDVLNILESDVLKKSQIKSTQLNPQYRCDLCNDWHNNINIHNK